MQIQKKDPHYIQRGGVVRCGGRVGKKCRIQSNGLSTSNRGSTRRSRREWGLKQYCGENFPKQKDNYPQIQEVWHIPNTMNAK